MHNFITFDEFKEFIEDIRHIHCVTSDIYRVSNRQLDLTNYGDMFFKVIEKLGTFYFKQDWDFITWWMYEDVEKKIYINDEEKDLTTVEQLYYYLKEKKK